MTARSVAAVPPWAAAALADAERLLSLHDLLDVEQWASSWLGAAWVAADPGRRDPEGDLCREVAAKAVARPTPSALAVVAALARIAPPSGREHLADAVRRLSRTVAPPAWLDAPPHRPVRAWRAVDVWDTRHMLFIDLDGPTPHTVMASVRYVGGTTLAALLLLNPGAVDLWSTAREPGSPPMPVTAIDLDDGLRELAVVLNLNDITWPRTDDENIIGSRAAAWSSCRDHVAFPDHEELDDAAREEVLAAFRARPDVTALDAEPDSVAYLATLCLDYGLDYIATGYLCWSPDQVDAFLVDWLPRKAHLDAADRAALPGVLRAWVRFALERRDVPAEWITPAVDAVDAGLPGFAEVVDDRSSWGPAKQLTARLDELGIDLTDRDAVDDVLRTINAENLARGMLDG